MRVFPRDLGISRRFCKTEWHGTDNGVGQVIFGRGQQENLATGPDAHGEKARHMFEVACGCGIFGLEKP